MVLKAQHNSKKISTRFLNREVQREQVLPEGLIATEIAEVFGKNQFHSFM